MQYFAGTSGYSFKDWKGKVPQVLTHFKRLKNVGKPMGQLVRAASALKAQPVLFPLPPNFKKGLESFLKLAATRGDINV